MSIAVKGDDESEMSWVEFADNEDNDEVEDENENDDWVKIGGNEKIDKV